MINKIAQDNLRYRILHAAGRLARSGRRRRLKISATWPWAPAITAVWDRITALPQAPNQQQTVPAARNEPTQRGPWNPRHPARQPGTRRTHTPK